jgi:hypothetical protein
LSGGGVQQTSGDFHGDGIAVGRHQLDDLRQCAESSRNRQSCAQHVKGFTAIRTATDDPPRATVREPGVITV